MSGSHSSVERATSSHQTGHSSQAKDSLSEDLRSQHRGNLHCCAMSNSVQLSAVYGRRPRDQATRAPT